MESPSLELNGYDYGDGSGYGYGYGYGSGDGSCDGSGDGSCDGYGYGYGSGDGYGYGSGSDVFLRALLATVPEPPLTRLAFWRSTADGKPANGGSGTKAQAGVTEEVGGPLEICTRRALHGTMRPEKWKGDHWWIVALHEPVVEQDDKLASLRRTFVKHLGKCPF